MKVTTGAETISVRYSESLGYRVGTPGESRKKHENFTYTTYPGTPGRKGWYMDLNKIPYGHDNAMQRPPDPLEDRKLRRAIEAANSKDDCIINVGHGYYRPIPGDPTDESELNEYLSKELHRARAIQSKRLAMRLTFERWREVGILTSDSGQTG